VPLSFIASEAPMYSRSSSKAARRHGVGDADVRRFAHRANNWINLQASWVRRAQLAQMALNAGCNDFMGTLINEASASAGARAADGAARMRGLIDGPHSRGTQHAVRHRAQFGIEDSTTIHSTARSKAKATSASARTRG
jgi:2-iminoacetate synthase ThiH